jgi:hypothetical protein
MGGICAALDRKEKIIPKNIRAFAYLRGKRGKNCQPPTLHIAPLKNRTLSIAAATDPSFRKSP